MQNRKSIVEGIVLEMYAAYLSNSDNLDPFSVEQILTAAHIPLTPEIMSEIYQSIEARIREYHDSKSKIEIMYLDNHIKCVIGELKTGLALYASTVPEKRKILSSLHLEKLGNAAKDIPIPILTIQIKLHNEIQILTQSTSGEKSLRDAMMIALYGLNITIFNNINKNLAEAIDEFKKQPSDEKGKNNYELLCTKHRKGMLSIFSSRKTNAQKAIEDLLSLLGHRKDSNKSLNSAFREMK